MPRLLVLADTLCEAACLPWGLGETKKRGSLVPLEVQSGQVSNLLERKISQDIWSGLPSGHHGPSDLGTVCWAAAAPAGCNRRSPEGTEGGEGTMSCLCTLRHVATAPD